MQNFMKRFRVGFLVLGLILSSGFVVVLLYKHAMRFNRLELRSPDGQFIAKSYSIIDNELVDSSTSDYVSIRKSWIPFGSQDVFKGYCGPSISLEWKSNKRLTVSCARFFHPPVFKHTEFGEVSIEYRELVRAELAKYSSPDGDFIATAYSVGEHGDLPNGYHVSVRSWSTGVIGTYSGNVFRGYCSQPVSIEWRSARKLIVSCDEIGNAVLKQTNITFDQIRGIKINAITIEYGRVGSS